MTHKVNETAVVNLHRAVELGFPNEVRDILASYPDSNEVNAWSKTTQWSPLHAICRLVDPEILSLLLAHPRIDVNNTLPDGWTPLIVAARYGNLQAVQMLLLDGRADLKAKTVSGKTALDFAHENGHHAVVKCLLDAQLK
ncbi:MAG: ankyrin repeat domain-containing protein [Nitrososphaerales archaeon]